MEIWLKYNLKKKKSHALTFYSLFLVFHISEEQTRKPKFNKIEFKKK